MAGGFFHFCADSDPVWVLCSYLIILSAEIYALGLLQLLLQLPDDSIFVADGAPCV